MLLRPIRPGDKPLLVEGMKRMSEKSRYRRFFSHVKELSEATLAYLTELDYVDHFAWIAIARDEPGSPGVGVARYIRAPDRPEQAEVAVAVVDEYQGRGLGTLLLEALGLVAREHGVIEFTANVLPENAPMREVLHEHGVRLRFDPQSGVLAGTGPITESPDDLKNSALYNGFRAAARGLVRFEEPRSLGTWD